MESNKWISAWCSIIGSSHITEGLPCQDSSRVEYIVDTNFLIAVISDGAGSCENSQIGSRFLVDNSTEKIASLIKLNGWTDNLVLDPQTWREEAFRIYTELKQELKLKSEEINVEFKSLSATLIIAISNGNFFACANVGDGRGAIRDSNGNWLPALTPTKGEEANQTLFITSEMWDNSIQSEFFGSFALNSPITALSILSDGCERASFEILKYNEEDDKYFDPNRPFKPFFEPNYLNLIAMKNANLEQEKINALWHSFIEKGTPALISETDDKSMILSVFITDNSDEGKV